MWVTFRMSIHWSGSYLTTSNYRIDNQYYGAILFTGRQSEENL